MSKSSAAESNQATNIVGSECLSEWVTDCMQTYGRVLDGAHAHWCPDWDYLPIDETCQEFESCICFPD
jgi:hypothetical protein